MTTHTDDGKTLQGTAHSLVGGWGGDGGESVWPASASTPTWRLGKTDCGPRLPWGGGRGHVYAKSDAAG